MKAAVYERYGPPEVVKVVEVATPSPAAGEVLIRVEATTITAGDARFRKADPWFLRFLNGISRPQKIKVLGMEVAGTVHAVGKDVSKFRPGDEVFGSTGFKFGAHAEYAAAVEALLVNKPPQCPFAEAAAIPFGGVSALHFLRAANISPGQNVLVYGASGNVGTNAVQLAKHFGARVTGVCSGNNVDLVKSLGADEVVDYTRQDYSSAGRVYDIVLDTVGKSGIRRGLRVLKPGGAYAFVASGLFAYAAVAAWAKLSGSMHVVGGVARARPDDLQFLAQLVAVGKLKPVIDRRYPLDQIVEAYRYADTGRKRGSIAILVGGASA